MVKKIPIKLQMWIDNDFKENLDFIIKDKYPKQIAKTYTDAIKDLVDEDFKERIRKKFEKI